MNTIQKRLLVAAFGFLVGCGDEGTSMEARDAGDTWESESVSWGTQGSSMGGPGVGPEAQEAEPIPCSEDRECPTGLCIDTGDGKQCAVPCSPGCDAGSTCRALELSGPDPMFLCIPDGLPLCRPCLADEDCQRFPGDEELVCTSAGSLEGSFCTSDCQDDWDCPPKALCNEGACWPAGGCTCLETNGNLGLVTSCARTNQFGACAGERGCTPDGMTECLAPEPAAEACDAQDNDCDGQTDEDLELGPCQLDSQWGTCPGHLECTGGSQVCYGSAPAPEACDGVDNDCDGQTDEGEAIGCVALHVDADLDGFGGQQTVCSCGLPSPASGIVANGLDCSDADPSVFPGAEELCDGVDNDCDSVVDDGCDADSDGYCAKPLPGATGPGFVCKSDLPDCDDAVGSTHPGAAEVCDGLDNDCDGKEDDGCDGDGDGYCSSAASVFGPTSTCKHVELDCDDSDPAVYPGAPESCNAQDDDCDATKDEGCDADGDGYCAGPPVPIAGCAGIPGIAQTACEQKFFAITCPSGFGDCDDQDPATHPGAPELCNQEDDDCDGTADEMLDADMDGWCAVPLAPGATCQECPKGGGDCNDADPAVRPDALDPPDALALDSNCDGVDGDAAGCVFVSAATGSDAWDGTMQKPKKSIAAGLAEAEMLGAQKCVLVAAGSYSGSLTVPDGTALWGGYDQAAGWKVSAAASSKISAWKTAITVAKGSSKTSIGRFTVEAAASPGAGQGAVGIRAVGASQLALSLLSVKAGSGQAGAHGTPGKQGLPGQNGVGGQAGCEPYCLPQPSGTCPDLALPGSGHGPYTCGGRGQGKTIYIPSGWDPDILEEQQWFSDQGGEPSCCFKQLASIGYGGAGGAEGPNYGGDGLKGQGGTSGPDGADGAGGNGSGVLGPEGFVPDNGDPGKPGKDGCGGGGGGMGDNFDEGWLYCDAWGGGGGGGGAGGTGGSGGTGGMAGGPSVAILLVDTKATISDSVLQSGKGGQGGNGGAAGPFGKGGKGGPGGPGVDGSGDGGAGGSGGDGGWGGVGGGGSGGASIALLHSCGKTPVLDSVSYLVEGGGKGGNAGTHGPLPGPAASNGKTGVSGSVVCLTP